MCAICSVNIYKRGGHCIHLSNNTYWCGGYLQNSQRTTMDGFVGVKNDVSLAVKCILQVKKAYVTQRKCQEVLTRKNELIQQRIGQLEKQNKDLENKVRKLGSDNQTGTQMECHEELTRKNKSLQQRVCQLEKRNKYLENGLIKLKDNNQQQQDLVSSLQQQLAEALLRDTNVVDALSDDAFVIEEPTCPTSPKKVNKQGCKRKVTPKKNTPPRKSRRLSSRNEKR